MLLLVYQTYSEKPFTASCGAKSAAIYYNYKHCYAIQ